MTYRIQREVDDVLNGQSLQTHRSYDKWYWTWGDWRSNAYDFLEVRPWTPQVIGNRLCFSGSDGEFWRVVWGNKEGPLVDDVYDIVEVHDEPIYIAREQGLYSVIRGNTLRSSQYNYQIVFRTSID